MWATTGRHHQRMVLRRERALSSSSELSKDRLRNRQGAWSGLTTERILKRKRQHLVEQRRDPGLGRMIRALQAERAQRTGRGTPYAFSFWRTAFHRWCAHLPLPPTTMRCTAHPRAPMFCSELVAYTLDMLGVLDVESHSGRTYDRLLPVDFSHDHAQRPLPLAPRFAYGPDVELLSDPRP